MLSFSGQGEGLLVLYFPLLRSEIWFLSLPHPLPLSPSQLAVISGPGWSKSFVYNNIKTEVAFVLNIESEIGHCNIDFIICFNSHFSHEE